MASHTYPHGQYAPPPNSAYPTAHQRYMMPMAPGYPSPYPWQGYGYGYPAAPGGMPMPGYGAMPMPAGAAVVQVGGMPGAGQPFPGAWPGAQQQQYGAQQAAQQQHGNQFHYDQAAPPHGHGQVQPSHTHGQGRGQGQAQAQPQARGQAHGQGARQPQVIKEPKREVVPKTAAEGAYSCTTCDRGFDNARDLSAHTAGHTQCEHPGCTFAAQRKIVMAHAAKAHGSGDDGDDDGEGDGGAVRDASGAVRLPPSLLELIPPKYRSASRVGDSEEDVARWRAERKRNYPTAATAAVKSAQAQARAMRGELQVTERGLAGRRAGGQGQYAGRYQATAAGRDGPTAGAHAGAKRPREEDGTDQADGPEEATGAGQLSSSASSGLSRWPAAQPGPVAMDHAQAERALLQALGGAAVDAPDGTADGDLASNDDDDQDDGPPEEESAGIDAYRPPPQHSHDATGAGAGASSSSHHRDTRLGVSSDDTDHRGPRAPQVCKRYIFGGCTAGARCHYAHSADARDKASARPGRNILGKLLEKEVLAETSMLLQCVRYIVRSQYFLDRPASGAQEQEQGQPEFGRL